MGHEMQTEKLTIAFVGHQWAAEELRKRFGQIGHQTLQLDPMRSERFGNRPKVRRVPLCDVVILVGKDFADLQWEFVDRLDLYTDKLVLDMTCLEWGVSHLQEDSLLAHIEARVPNAQVVAVGSIRVWGQLVDGFAERVYFCGRDPVAKARANALLRSLGFDTEDLGGPRAARLLHTISGMHGRRQNYRIRPRDTGDSDEPWLVAPDEATEAARIELRAERISDATGAYGLCEWIRLSVGAYSIDLLGVPDRNGYVLMRRLSDWIACLSEDEAHVFQADFMGEKDVVSLGHRRTTLPEFVGLTIDRKRGRRFVAVVPRARLLTLLLEARELLDTAIKKATAVPQLAKSLFARAEGGQLIIEGISSLPEGTEVRLAPVAHIEQEGYHTRIHDPGRFDTEVFRVPTKQEEHELECPNTPEPALSIEAHFELPATGWASVTVCVGHHEVLLSVSDCVEQSVDIALRSLQEALTKNTLPYRYRADEEGEKVSLGVRLSSDPELVLLTVSNLTTVGLEALVPRVLLLEELTKVNEIIGRYEWVRPRG